MLLFYKIKLQLKVIIMSTWTKGTIAITRCPSVRDLSSTFHIFDFLENADQISMFDSKQVFNFLFTV